MANRYWVGGTGTWNTTSTTNWSATSGGASGASVPTAADSVFFDQAATYTVTMTGALNCLDITVSGGTVTFATGTSPTLSVAGNWSTIAGTVWSMTNAVTFTATTAKTLTSGGITINSPFTFNGAGGSWTLQDNFTFATTVTTTLTTGTLALGSFTLSTGLFASSGTGVRTLNFGTGKIALRSAAISTVWNTGTVTNLTVSGTPLVECSGGGTAVTKTINTGALSEANSISFSLLETTGTATYVFTAGNVVKNLTINGVQTLSNIAITIYGDFTHSTTNGTTTFTAGANAWTFAATSGSYTITNLAATTYDFPWTFGSATSTATWTLAANLVLGATRQLTLTNGTLDVNNKTLTGGGLTILTGTPTLNNTGGTTVSITTPITHTSGTLTLGTNLTTTSASGYTFMSSTNTGGLNLNNFILTTTTFTTTATTGAKTLAFGTGKIVLNGAATATIFNIATAVANITVSGTPLVECQGGGTAVTKTINTGAATEANAISFSLLETTGTVTYAFTATNAVKNLITNGVQTVSNIAITIFGNFTHSTTNGTTTFTAGANAWTFGATSGSYSLGYISGFTYDFPWIFGSAASTATWTLPSNLTLGATRLLTLVTGTFDFNSKTFSGSGIFISNTVGTFTLANTGTASFTTTLPITHAVGTFTLPFDVTTSSTSGFTFFTGTNTGTLNLNNFILTTPVFTTTATTGAKTLAFGTGKIVLNGTATATVFNISTAVANVTVTGTPLVECTGGGTTVTKTINTGAATEGNSISFSLLSTTGTSTYTFTAGNTVKNLIVNGVQTVSNIAITIYGAFTHSTTNGTTTFTAGANAWTFAATSGSYTITNVAGFTYDFPWTFGSATSTATWTLANNLTLGATRQLTLTNGTTDFNSKTLSAAGITIITGTPTIANTGTASFTTTLPITHTSGTFTLPFNVTTSSASGYTFTAGTLGLGTFTLTTPTFVSNSSTARTLNFGTGKIVLNANTTSTIWNQSTITNFTVAGTSLVECIGGGTGVTKTINISAAVAVAQTINFSLLETSGTVTYTFTASAGIANLTVNGSQTVSNSNLFLTSFTHLITNGNTTFTAGTNAWVFWATSGSYNITNIAGFTYDFPWTIGFQASTATYTLQANLTLGATRQLTLTNGTLDFNSKTLSAAGITILTGTPSIANTGTGSFTTTLPFTHTSGTFTLPFNVTTSAATGYTFTAGTLALGSNTLTTPVFVSNGGTARTLNFGTGQLALTGNSATIFDTTTATSFTTSGTVYINCTYTGSTGTRTIVTGFTEAQAASYNVATSGTSGIVLSPSATDTVALTGSFNSIDLTGFTGTLSNTARTIYGNLTTPASGGTYTAGTLATTFGGTSGTDTITTNGRTLDFPITFSGAGGTFQLADNLTVGSTRTVTHTAGTLNLNNFVLSTGLFVGTSSTARTLAFGTGQLALTGNASTIFDITTGTNLTITGTVYVNSTYTGATGTRTFVTSGLTAAQALSFTLATTGTSGIVISSSATDTIALTGNFGTLNFTGFTGTLSNTARTLYANLILPAVGGTFTAGTVATTFASTTAATITSNGRTLDFPITFNGVGGNWTLQDGMTVGSTRTTTLTAGTLTLGSFTLSTGLFNSSGTTARTIAFGTGQLALTGNAVTIFDLTTTTNLTTTGTVYINCTYTGATGTRTIVTGLTEVQSAGFDVATSGTSGIVLSPSATDIVALTGNFNNINLTGFTGTLSNTARTLYGNLTVPASGGTYTAGANATTFAATGGTKTITTNSRTLDFPITFNGVGGTFQLAGNLTLGTTRAITLTAGTLDLNNFTFTGASLSSNGTGVRSLQFGTTGQITLVGNAATILDFTTATNFTYTGTLRIYSNYNGATGTRTFNFGGTAGATTTNDFDVSIGTSGTGLVIRAGTDSVDLAGVYNNVDLTGLTMTIPNSAKTIYGNLTIPGTGGALTAGANALTFAGTGTQTITTNGRTLDFPITINGVGGTFQLQDNLLQGTTRAFTHTNGTLNLNGKTLTVGTTYTTAAGTKNLTFNGGTLICPAASVTSFNNAVPAGFTTTAGSGTGTISMTAATAKTFVGGGVTYNCDIDNNGAGALTITGINTFNTIKSSYANATANTSILLPAGNTTITVGIVGGSASNKILALSTAANTRANVVISNASIQTASFLSTNSIVFIAGTLPTDGSVPWRWYLANSVNNGDTFGAVFQRYNIDAPIIYYIRSGTTFKVPYDWNNANNSVHLYGGGGGSSGSYVVSAAGNRLGSAGGGGGGYTRVLNFSTTPGSTVSYSIGAGGTAGGANTLVSGGNGGITTFASIYTANGGSGSSITSTTTTAGAGGTGATANGGSGGAGGGAASSTDNSSGGGGGGSGGPNGVGGSGGVGTLQTTAAPTVGAGGGGSGGGTNGTNAAASVPGTGGNNFAGTRAGGNGGTGAASGIERGRASYDIVNSIGGGGGGGGGSATGTGTTDDLAIGGGAGGSGADEVDIVQAGTAGQSGGIIIVYYPVASDMFTMLQ